MSYWQLVFFQSKVNRGAYDGDRLPRQNWSWPQQTWFQERLRYIRKRHHVAKPKDRPSSWLRRGIPNPNKATETDV